MKEKQIEQRYLTVREAADYLRCSPQTIYNRISRKSVNPFPVKPARMGRKPLFDRRDLDAYLDALKAEAAA
jgi:excisionase family DNA binding protein